MQWVCSCMSGKITDETLVYVSKRNLTFSSFYVRRCILSGQNSEDLRYHKVDCKY